MEQKAKKLYINTSKEMHLSFNLCIVHPELYEWFYENFVNIVILGDSQYFTDFIDNSIDYSYRELMDERVVHSYGDFPEEDSIIRYLIDSIGRDFYSAVWVDKYYIPDNESYMSWHFVHGILVYGYDDAKKTVSFVNFSFEKGIILQEIAYGDFIQAFANGEKHYKQGGGTFTLSETVTSFKARTNHSNNIFELDRFIAELRDYLESTVNISKLRRVHFNAGDMTYGIAVYDKLMELAEQFKDGITDSVIPFKSLSDLCIHKDYMYDRLAYIKNNFEITAECAGRMEEFKKVPDLWHRAKSLNMKYNVMDGKMSASFSHNPKFISKFSDILKESQVTEKEILGDIYNSLKKYALPKSKMQNILGEGDFKIECMEDNTKIRILLNEPKLIEYIEIIDNNEIPNVDGTKKIYFDDGTEAVVNGRQYNVLHKNRIVFKPKKVEWFEYREEETAYLRRDTKKLDFCIYKPIDKFYWNFASSKYLCCERKAEMAFAEFAPNVQQGDADKQKNRFKLIGNDPNITYDVSFDADKSKYVYFKYDTACRSENAQLFFATYEHPALSEDKSKVFTISPGDRAFEYIVDMSDNGKWDGVAKQLRFDPVSYDNTSKEGECTIEYIEISDRLPTYGSEKDYMKTQGVNGWSYHTYNNGTTYREMAWDGEAGVWAAVNDNETIITPTLQTSRNHMGTVRRWTCPAEGRYRVTYSFGQTADNRPDRDRLSSVTLRRNHRVMEKDTYDGYTGTLAGSHEAELTLERGETLNFEFYNGSEHTTETLEISIVIEKL